MQDDKKELLKSIVLNSTYPYSIFVYKLINEDYLKKSIKKIDNIGVPCNVNPKEITTAEEQFLQLLNRFIIFFDNYFFFLHTNSFSFIQTIIESNYKETEKYLLSKHYLGDNDYITFFQDSIYRIIVTNFVKNMNSFPSLKKLFKKEKIAIKNINDYSLKEIMQIINLLSNISFANYHSPFNNLLLFEDINKNTSKMINRMKKKNASEKQIVERTESLMNFYTIQIDSLIEKYEEKKIHIFYVKKI